MERDEGNMPIPVLYPKYCFLLRGSKRTLDKIPYSIILATVRGGVVGFNYFIRHSEAG